MKYQEKTSRSRLHEYTGIMTQAFGLKAEDTLRWTPQHAVRTLVREKSIAAGLIIFNGGQWFGGRRLVSGLVAGVAVAPEHRGSGAGRRLMRGMLEELHSQRVPLSALYASTSAFYRKLGYALAGDYSRWDIPSSVLPTAAGNTLTPVKMDLSDSRTQDTVNRLYTGYAQRHDGMLDRPAVFWQRKLTPHDSKRHLYIVCTDPADPHTTAQGYVLLIHERSDHRLEVADTAASNAAAADAILNLLAAHRSVTDRVRFAGPENSPPLMRIPDHARITRCDSERWLLRIVHPAAALEQRGYPSISIRLRIQITDSTLPQNSGEYLLQLDDGKATVVAPDNSARPADLAKDIPVITATAEGLAALFCSSHPGQLAAADLLGGNEAGLKAARLVFHGDTPCITDKF